MNVKLQQLPGIRLRTSESEIDEKGIGITMYGSIFIGSRMSR